jgi:hypothetical protein
MLSKARSSPVDSSAPERIPECETLAQSASFGSHKEAKRAARIVYRGASLASFEGRSGHTPRINLPARSDAATARDRVDAERWLDEGGSFNSEAVTR